MELLTTPERSTRQCPRCSQVVEQAVDECPRCQVIIDKASRAERPEAAAETGSSAERDYSMSRLAECDELYVKQGTERLEMFSGFETANHYTVNDALGHTLFVAAEESGSLAGMLSRNFLKAYRPFTIHVKTPSGEPVLTLTRPFRLWFDELQVLGPSGRPLGSIKKELSFTSRRYTVSGPGGNFELLGSLFRLPWSFMIMKDGQACGSLDKKWSGLVKEMLSDADNFRVDFPRGLDITAKSVLLGAVFLIDFVYFEDNG